LKAVDASRWQIPNDFQDIESECHERKDIARRVVGHWPVDAIAGNPVASRGRVIERHHKSSDPNRPSAILFRTQSRFAVGVQQSRVVVETLYTKSHSP
jgi:hypothetical protein